MINLYTEDSSESLVEEYRKLQIHCRELEERYRELSEKYSSLLHEHEELKQNRSKAGRKPNDEKWTARYQAFASLKQEGARREQIQLELNMSRATYFRYNKIYSENGVSPVSETGSRDSSERNNVSVSSGAAELNSVLASPDEEVSPAAAPGASVSAAEEREGLVLDPVTGEYVTPEGLKRRRKLAEIRARRAAQKEAVLSENFRTAGAPENAKAVQKSEEGEADGKTNNLS